MPTLLQLVLSAICTLQALLRQIYHLKAQSSRRDSCATWRGVQDLEKALDVDTGRQYLKKGPS